MNTIDGNKKIRIGVLGCGPISQAAHFEACIKAGNAELYAVCDVAEDLLVKMASKHDVAKAYNNYDDMLADQNVDAVIIGIADQFHIECAEKALDAGKHVLIEKPLGVDSGECLKFRKIAAEKDLVVQIGNMKRFDPGIAFARDFIKNEIGELLAIKAWYCDSIYRYQVTDNVQPVIYRSDKARKPAGDVKKNKERYYMFTHGSHLVDTARYLCGPIRSVQARMLNRFNAYSWLVSVEFENGCIGNLDLTVAVRMDWHEGFNVYGEYGSVLAKTYNPWLFKSSDVEVFSVKDGLYRRPLGEDAHFYKLQVEAFADSILNNTPIKGASVEDGEAAVRALVAITRSVQTGDKVLLTDI